MLFSTISVFSRIVLMIALRFSFSNFVLSDTSEYIKNSSVFSYIALALVSFTVRLRRRFWFRYNIWFMSSSVLSSSTSSNCIDDVDNQLSISSNSERYACTSFLRCSLVFNVCCIFSNPSCALCRRKSMRSSI
uniref:(northern house mosquito) hypothetical protein n=1 Tax=Culex pipiens TaxID=7175 RepID=A0A8D8B9Q8_CULPI